MHVKTIEVADLNSKFAFEGLKPGLYTVELKINGKGNVTKIMRIL
jgi:YbbR domain-containing protein